MSRWGAALVCLAGCGRFGFASIDGSSSGDDGNAGDTSDVDAGIPADARLFVYSSSRGTSFDIFSADPFTGALTPAGSFNVGSRIRSATVNPTGTAMYVATDMSNLVITLRIDSMTGALSRIDQDAAGTTVADITGTGLVVHPSGKYLYMAGNSIARVYAFSIAADDTLTPITGSPFTSPGTTSNWVAVHPAGRWLYTSDFDNVHVLEVNQNDGTLAQRPALSLPVAGSAWDCAIDPSGTHGYIAPESETGIPTFSIDASTGQLTNTTGSPFGTMAFTAFSIMIDPTGRHVSVTNNSIDEIAIYTADPATGALTHMPGSPIALASSSWGQAVSPFGNLVYAVELTATPGILGFRLDGGLTPLGRVATLSTDYVWLARTH